MNSNFIYCDSCLRHGEYTLLNEDDSPFSFYEEKLCQDCYEQALECDKEYRKEYLDKNGQNRNKI